MEEDRRRWNEKHRDAPIEGKAAAVVRRFARLAPRGLALDLAAGRGRHARYLAGLGFRVEAVDISEVGLSGMARQPNIAALCADLERFEIPAGRYSLILDIRYLQRRLFPQMASGLIPGGMLIVETFLEAPGGATDCRFRPDYLLKENELLREFNSLRILYYREAETRDPETPSRIASLVALQPNPPAARPGRREDRS
jgi:SAM-dependent methyltransferase